MTDTLRFGVATLQDGTWPEMVQRWQSIEALGLDSVWLADHFVNYVVPSAPWFEPWTLLSALAPQTKTIRMGVISVIPWRNPALLARMIMTVDHICGGRLELALGAGAPGDLDPSYAMTGTPDWPAPERVERFKEVVEILNQLLTSPVSSYNGKYYQLKDTIISPLPVQKPRPPLMICCNKPRMLKLAALYGDAWNTFGGEELNSCEEMFEITRARCEILQRACEEVGRDPATLRKSLLIFGPEGQKMYTEMNGFEDVVERYRTLGFSEFLIYYPWDKVMMPFYEHAVNEVIPRLVGRQSAITA